MTELSEVLDSVASVSRVAAGALSGPPAVVARIVSVALDTAAAFARAGRDPVAEIERIHAADPALRAVHAGWDKLIEDKFGTPSEPPPAADTPEPVTPPPDTEPGADPYDEEEA